MLSTMSTAPPALKGDGNGRYRILIVGNSGVGKSTTMRRLSSLLGISAVSLDLLYFKPGWKAHTPEEFLKQVRSFTELNDEWIIDGNYLSKLKDVTYKQATDIVWLDPPALLYLPRVFIRTMRRLFGIPKSVDATPVGCQDTFTDVFFGGKDSILLWAITRHSVVREQYTPMHAIDAVEKGGKWRRLGGWGSTARAWFEQLDELAKHRRERMA
ncbi:hypothetical protein BKA62DRAFT_56478 [Auriculariales sp. MPI-PUGE-AT-0066]|nr:hypothetical protein BKA62DRAFT_56478 [Auriculariales sp. MPI-PUGE-AT-0066]